MRIYTEFIIAENDEEWNIRSEITAAFPFFRFLCNYELRVNSHITRKYIYINLLTKFILVL